MKKIFIILVILAICVVIAVQLAVAPTIKRLAVKELNKLVTTQVSIERIGVNVFTGVVSFSGLSIKNPPYFIEENFLRIKNGYFDISMPDLLFKRFEIQKVFLDRPEVNCEINRRGVLNARLVFKKTDPGIQQVRANTRSARTQGRQESSLPVLIGKVRVSNGVFTLMNRHVSLDGATVRLDKVNLSITNLRASRHASEMPTLVRGSARLPAERIPGDLQYEAQGDFLSPKKDFDLAVEARDISIVYFMPFYRSRAPLLATSGIFDLSSRTTCRRNKLNATQEVSIRDLVVTTNPMAIRRDTVFGLPIDTVIDFFNKNQETIRFDFGITGDLTNPQFHLAEALQEVVAKSIGRFISRHFEQLPTIFLEKMEETGDIEKAGKEALKELLGDLLLRKKDQQQGGQ